MDLARAIRKTEILGQDGNSTMQIAYGVDHNFIRPMGISMTSILEYNPQAQFHIFLDDISSEDKARIQRTVERYHSSCTIYYVDSSIFKTFPVRSNWSVAVYFRFFTAEVLYGKSDRLLYVDADVLCIGTLDELFSMDMKENTIAAVSDPSFADKDARDRHMKKIGCQGTDYFNAGIILIDLNRWHAQNVSNTAICLLSENPSRWVVAQDQDVLNVLLGNETYWLSVSYNYRATLADTYSDEIALVHYSGSPKPWTELYFSNAKISPFELARQISEWKEVPLQAPRTAQEKRFMSKKSLLYKDYIGFMKWQIKYLYQKLWK